MTAKKAPDYSFRYRVLHAIRWRLTRIGIRTTPFVTIREGGVPPEPVPAAGPFTLVELTAADIDDIFALDPEFSREQMKALFDAGKLCFGLREGSRLVAKSWCDLDEVTYELAPRKLRPGEAYLFAAYSDPAYRGRNLAPILRAACYEELRRRGCTRLFSYSDFFNLSARRFKQKLGGIEEDLRIHVDLFGRWRRTLKIWRY